MKEVNLLLGIVLAVILWGCSDKNSINSCACETNAQTQTVDNYVAKVGLDDETGMYLLYHFLPNSIDAVNVYMVDNQKDIEKICTLKSEEVTFSGTAMKSTYTPKSEVAGTEFYCITLSSVEAYSK